MLRHCEVPVSGSKQGALGFTPHPHRDPQDLNPP